MFVILLNCITLAMYQPCSEVRICTMKCKVLEIVDHAIFGYFAAEMVLKMAAMGIFGAKAYLSDSWNRLDFFIVVAGCAASRYDDISQSGCVDWNQYYDSCRPDAKNPFGGAISFDNILYALVTVFVLLALNGWVDIMYYVQDVHSFWNWVYFVMLIVVGTFYMLNLFLAVIASQFAETKGREMEKMAAERALEEEEGRYKKSKREILRERFLEAKRQWVARFGICLPKSCKKKSNNRSSRTPKEQEIELQGAKHKIPDTSSQAGRICESPKASNLSKD